MSVIEVRTAFDPRASKSIDILNERRFIAFVGFTFFAFGCSRVPATYDECILEKLSAGMDKSVAGAVVSACRNKFPEKTEPAVLLTKFPLAAVKNITGRFGVNFYGGSGNFYNGNENWRIEEVTITITELGWLEKTLALSKNPEAETPRTERYKVKVSVPPLTSKDFTLEVNWREDEKYEWFITEVRGFKDG